MKQSLFPPQNRYHSRFLIFIRCLKPPNVMSHALDMSSNCQRKLRLLLPTPFFSIHNTLSPGPSQLALKNCISIQQNAAAQQVYRGKQRLTIVVPAFPALACTITPLLWAYDTDSLMELMKILPGISSRQERCMGRSNKRLDRSETTDYGP